MLNSYLTVGGLPVVVKDYFAKRDFQHSLGSIVADYEQDFIRLFGENDLAIVKACLQSVANFTGSPSKNSSVVPSPTTIVHHKINKIFARLEQWKLIFRSQQHGISPEKSHRYLPKRYLFDTGILRYYREAGLPAIDFFDQVNTDIRKPLGGIIENQVAIELARKSPDLHGWKKSPSGMEIDFLLKVNNKVIPIECKSALKIKNTHLKGVISYLEMYGQKKAVVISLSPQEHIFAREKFEIINIPLYAVENIWDIV